MANPSGYAGAVALLTGINADFNSWGLRVSHPIDDITHYGDTLVGASHNGSGTATYSFDASGFLKSNEASTAPGIGLASATVIVATQVPGAITLTVKGGCTFTGSALVSGASIGHAKRAASVVVGYDGVFSGDVTETWAVS